MHYSEKYFALISSTGISFPVHRRNASWLDMPGLEAAYGIPLGEVWKPVLEQWERAGLVERDGAFIVLTLAGQFWQVNLSQLLLDYLKRSLEA